MLDKTRGSMLDKTRERERERAEIERLINAMTEDELKGWCKDNLYFEEDYMIDRWVIDAENI